MTSGGWQQRPSQQHGRHRRGSSGSAWTPSVRPRESGQTPAHARPDPVPGRVRPGLTPMPPPSWPTVSQEPVRPAHAADPGPAWPDPDTPAVAGGWGDHLTPPVHAADPGPAWPDPGPPEVPARAARSEWADHGAPALSPAFEAEPEWDLGAPPMSSLPTAPLSLTRIREERERQRRDEPVVHTLPPETPPSGLRKFDLGTVPASVTPPRTWRKAAWFAVGTSAAVMVGLAYAAVEFVGQPGEPPLIDALPADPTRPWTIEPLPAERSSISPDQPVSSHGGPRDSSSAHNPGTTIGDSPVETTDAPSTPGSRPTSGPGIGTTTPTEPPPPNRTTVGPTPLTPTNPQAMGDVTEAYYAKVTEDPAAAHELTSGGMAREGAEAIEARYEGVERVEVQEITIDRNQATTTSTVKLVHEDGTETIEQRQLTFTGGGDPKITDEATTA